MKRILMAIMAVAVAVTFSAPSFAEETTKEKKEGAKLVQMLNADDKDKTDKKAEKPKDDKDKKTEKK